jgi:type 1 glutamine amidotransferase
VLLAWADTRNGQAQHAFTSHALAIVERLGYDSGLWDTFIRTDSHIIYDRALKTDGSPASGGPSLSNVDGIFFLGHREIEMNAQQKEELLAFVRSGHGFVAAHTGLTAFDSWPEFGQMLGAQYGGHLYTGPGQVISERPDHPIVKHWGAAFSYNDEFYRPKGLSRDTVDVLLRFNPASAPSSKLPADGDFPLVWTKTYGQGRVFYSSLSHATEAWDIRDLQVMMFEAIRWSLGLTDAPVMPHAMPAAAATP